jgi:hypothetical protein
MRFFLAHSKAEGEDPDTIGRILDRVRGIVGKGHEIVLGRDEFTEHIGSSGGWDGWTASISTRVDPDSGQRVYDGIIVPSHRVGKATAAIVRCALDVSMPVFALQDRDASPFGPDEIEDGADEVGHVEMTTPRDYKTGWTLSPF